MLDVCPSTTVNTDANPLLEDTPALDDDSVFARNELPGRFLRLWTNSITLNNVAALFAGRAVAIGVPLPIRIDSIDYHGSPSIIVELDSVSTALAYHWQFINVLSMEAALISTELFDHLLRSSTSHLFSEVANSSLTIVPSLVSGSTAAMADLLSEQSASLADLQDHTEKNAIQDSTQGAEAQTRRPKHKRGSKAGKKVQAVRARKAKRDGQSPPASASM